jgi:hypothetical protein
MEEGRFGEQLMNFWLWGGLQTQGGVDSSAMVDCTSRPPQAIIHCYICGESQACRHGGLEGTREIAR